MEIRPETRTLPHAESSIDEHAGYTHAYNRGSSEVGTHTKAEEKRLLRLAGNLLARARDFESRMTAIETASQACKCAKTVSATIVDILDEAKNLLSKMREVADPDGRLVLAKSFNSILEQIDSIVDAGYYDSNNLARNESIHITIDNLRREGFEIAGIDMSCSGLGLTPFESDRVSNTEIIERLSKAETAACSLVAHSLSYDSIAVLLQSRMKFARGMVGILEDGNHQINSSRAGHEAIARAVSDICQTIEDDDTVRTARRRDSDSGKRDNGVVRDSPGRGLL